MHDGLRKSLAAVAILLGSSGVWCVDAPVLRFNEASGYVEVVDSAWSGANYNVRFTQSTPDGDSSGSMLLTTNSGNDVDPRLANSPLGDTFVVWWRDLKTDVVIYRKRTYATGSWGPERILGKTNESGSRPRIAYFQSDACVAYQIQYSKTRSIGTQIIDDDPEPFRTIVATTSYTGDLDIQLNSEMNHLWVTWIDSASVVGYSEYHADTRLWDLPAFEPFAGGSSTDARTRIRQVVLNIAPFN